MTRVISARRRDDGFTVIELVIAAAVLFFAMTALVGVLGASTRMTASAKGRSVLTNAITSEIEKIRALPYEKVAYESAGGAVPHSKTVVTPDGVTVTLSFTITDRSSQNFTKEITVRGLASRPGVPDVRYSTFAVFYDRIRGRTGAAGADGPLIEFTDETPPDGSVLDGPKIGGTGTNIQIKSHAWTQDGSSNITRFEYTVDGIDNVTGSRATLPLKETNTVYPGALSWHDVPTPSPDERWAFYWNTNQRDTANLPEVPDGMRTVTIIAFDDQGRSSPAVRRRFLVDNYGPTTAPEVTLTADKNPDFTQSVTLSWGTVLDGDYPTDHYSYQLYRKTTSSETLTDWTSVPLADGSKTAVATGMAYYAARAQGRSVLDKPGPWGYSAAVLTSPIIGGTHDVSRVKASGSNDKWTYTCRFTLAKPDVPYSSVSAVVLERTGGGTSNTNIDVTSAAVASWTAGGAYAHTDSVAQTIKKNVTPSPPEYRLKVVLTPAGTSSALTAYSQYAKGTVPAISNTSPPATNLAYEQRW